jgi:hypothetical protein
VSLGLTLGVLLVALASCESRNPAAIWAERSARAGDSVSAEDLSAPAEEVEGLEASGEDESSPAESDIAGRVEPDTESEVRRVLSGGVEVAATTTLVEGLRRIDVAQARRTGDIDVATNDSSLDHQLAPLFDGNTRSVVRSEEINPLFITFTFETPVSLRAVRVFPSYSSYDWGLQARPDAEWLVVQNASGQAWSAIELQYAARTEVVRVELLRRQRDDFVHLNEIELWTEPDVP